MLEINTHVILISIKFVHANTCKSLPFSHAECIQKGACQNLPRPLLNSLTDRANGAEVTNMKQLFLNLSFFIKEL